HVQFAFGLALVALGARPLTLQSQTVIHAAKVLDGTGRIIPNGTVVVRGSKVVSVGARTAGEKGDVIDLSGLTALPGLIDAHSHFAWHFNPQGKLHQEKDGETPEQADAAIRENLLATLRAGVTTV